MAESTVLNLVLWLPALGLVALALWRSATDRQVRAFTTGRHFRGSAMTLPT